jgi:hypothetical protein
MSDQLLNLMVSSHKSDGGKTVRFAKSILDSISGRTEANKDINTNNGLEALAIVMGSTAVESVDTKTHQEAEAWCLDVVKEYFKTLNAQVH